MPERIRIVLLTGQIRQKTGKVRAYLLFERRNLASSSRRQMAEQRRIFHSSSSFLLFSSRGWQVMGSIWFLLAILREAATKKTLPCLLLSQFAGPATLKPFPSSPLAPDFSARI